MSGGRGARSALLAAVLLAACTRAAPDATPEGAVRLWVEKMESSGEDRGATREAYELLGARARANLKERAERASRGQGRRYEPWEMIAEGRFGLRFRPKTMKTRIEGDVAYVQVRGEGPDETATVRCTREGAAWRLEPELPPVAAPTRRDGGL